MDIVKELEARCILDEAINKERDLDYPYSFNKKCLDEIQQLRNRVKELEEANKLLAQWVGQLGVEARRLGVHVTINGLDYAETLKRLDRAMENKNEQH